MLCRFSRSVVVFTCVHFLEWDFWLPNRAIVIVIVFDPFDNNSKDIEHLLSSLREHAQRRGLQRDIGTPNQRNALVLAEIATFPFETLEANRASTCTDPNGQRWYPPRPQAPAFHPPPYTFGILFHTFHHITSRRPNENTIP